MRRALIKHDGMHTHVGEPEPGDERGPYSEEELRAMNDAFTAALAREQRPVTSAWRTHKRTID